MTNQDKILVTGGSGFIGTNLIDLLLSFNQNLDILNLDIQKPKKVNHEEYWKICDINNKIFLSEVIDEFKPSHIIHLAAKTDLKESNDLNYYKTNVTGVTNLVDSIKSLDTLKSIVFTSSMFVCKNGYIPKTDTDFCPDTLYGKSKVKTEEIVRYNSNKFNFQWTIIRPTSIWGPWFGSPYIDFFKLLKENKYFHPGSKSCTKSYGYVGNTVYQILAILYAEKQLVDSRTFYLGDLPQTNIEEWANEIAKYSNVKIYRLPLFIFKTFAVLGDLLNWFNIDFPMTSFRLKNMTTDNKENLLPIHKITDNIPYTRTEGIKETLKWLNCNT